MSNQTNYYNLEQYCFDTGDNLLNYWDYDLNDKLPNEVAKSTNKKYYFKCPRNLHESRQIVVNSITKAHELGRDYCLCNSCNSIGQYIIDTYGEHYLSDIWSEKNALSPFEVARRSLKRIYLKCQNNNTHPDYDLPAASFMVSHNCPYCAGKRVCETNSFGYVYKDYIDLWSDKNDKSPYDFTYGSNAIVWWRCENNIHGDYKRSIDATIMYKFRCPECGRKNQKIPRGKEHPNWKGGITTQAQKDRKSPKYNKWRECVYEKDNYTCQCCGKWGYRLTAHHILDYANYEDLRFDVVNGITVCFNCHDATVEGAFHNLYGTHNKTPQELEEYINNKRKELGILIPFNIDDYKEGSRLNKDSIKEIEDFFKVWKFVPYLAGGIKPVKNDNGFVKIKPKFRIKEE